ncbi:MAG: hypothetical protein AAFX56_15935 [Pseudomonadota bacterium]
MNKPNLTLEAFRRLDFDPESFGHREHVYAAWLAITRLGDRAGSDCYVSTLKALTEKLGVPEKYHETITRFYLTLIAERIRRHADPEWAVFEAANADLFERALLDRYYSTERLWSEEAHRHFLLPDRPAVRKAA